MTDAMKLADELMELYGKAPMYEGGDSTIPWVLHNHREENGRVWVGEQYGDLPVEVHALIHQEDFGYTAACAIGNFIVASHNNLPAIIARLRELEIGAASERVGRDHRDTMKRLADRDIADDDF